MCRTNPQPICPAGVRYVLRVSEQSLALGPATPKLVPLRASRMSRCAKSVQWTPVIAGAPSGGGAVICPVHLRLVAWVGFMTAAGLLLHRVVRLRRGREPSRTRPASAAEADQLGRRLRYLRAAQTAVNERADEPPVAGQKGDRDPEPLVPAAAGIEEVTYCWWTRGLRRAARRLTRPGDGNPAGPRRNGPNGLGVDHEVHRGACAARRRMATNSTVQSRPLPSPPRREVIE